MRTPVSLSAGWSPRSLRGEGKRREERDGRRREKEVGEKGIRMEKAESYKALASGFLSDPHPALLCWSVFLP